MGDKTGIEWTDATWNPLAGCSLVSPGCTNCYAMKEAARLERMGGKGGAKYAGLTKASKAGPVWTGEVRLHSPSLSQPLRWGRARRIFVNSMSDLFHESVPDEAIDRVFVVMALAARHTFQVLTKRSARMRAYIAGFSWERAIASCTGPDGVSVIPRHSVDDLRGAFGLRPRRPSEADRSAWPVPNVWLGVSVEDQPRADERIPDLLRTLAAVRFVSMEPLLRLVDLTRVVLKPSDAPERGKPPVTMNALRGWHGGADGLTRLDWVIVGGENGPRPMHPDWVRAVRDACARAGVAFLFKQWGSWGLYGPRDKDGALKPIEAFALANDGALYRLTDLAYPDGPRRSEAIRSNHDSAALHTVYRVGKRLAGQELDGRTHDEMPPVYFVAEVARIGTQSSVPTLASG